MPLLRGTNPYLLHTYMRQLLLFTALWLLACTARAQQQEVALKLVQTSDVHGNYFPTDFVNGGDAPGGLARVAAFVAEQRARLGDRLLLVDNGDILQGQPSAYYYNYIDTTSTHLCAQMLNYLDYDAGNVGNHDVETGRAVMDRWAAQCSFPVLGANMVDTSTGEPHFRPYTVLQRQGVKVAILGLITPAIPAWLPQNLWHGLRFDDMEQTARRWMRIIREREHPDVVIGLFHSGKDPYVLNGRYRENAAAEVARRVPGFDVVLMGHDHATACQKVVNTVGDSVLIINPANNARLVAEVDLRLTLSDGRVQAKHVEGRLTSMDAYEPDATFMARFALQREAVAHFVARRIGRLTHTISTRDAYFGPSAFVDLIHRLQLDITGADISLAAPLSLDARLEQGDITVASMFNLYKYENLLYTMRLTGREVVRALELSYARWTRPMHSPTDSLLRLRTEPRPGAEDRARFVHPSYNFDTAAGLRYTVDLTRPDGQKIHVLSMADGSPFDPDKTYRVAVNSYRGNGGGELLTLGAGIAQEDLPGRVISSTDRDLRYYLMQHIEQAGTIDPQPLNHWTFIPDGWADEAKEREMRWLFGEETLK